MASAAGLLANAATVTGGNGSPSGPVGDQVARSHRTDGAGICPGDRLCPAVYHRRAAARRPPVPVGPVPAEPAQVRAGGPDGGRREFWLCRLRSGSLRRSCSRIWSGRPSLAGGQDPERVRAVLDRFYDAMAAEVERAGGTVEKFVGDAVMAAFGAPVAHEDDAERALHVALGMQRRMAELFGGRLALRIGVNTGDVVAGRPREGSSFVTGDAVNVCARLEQAAAPGEIVVGERTVAAAGRCVRVRRAGDGGSEGQAWLGGCASSWCARCR